MEERKSYGQFCALARSLDRVGDRWTLLVVRELLVGPASFRALQQSLAGIAPNLLVARLRRMEAEGLVRRSGGPARSKSVAYELTDMGRGLEPAVLALIRWGAAWMASGPGDDVLDPRWGLLALRAFVDGPPPPKSPTGRVHVRVGGLDATVDVRRRQRTLTAALPDAADAIVAGSFEGVLAVASGLAPFAAADFAVEGDARLAAAALVPRPAISQPAHRNLTGPGAIMAP